MPRRGTPGELNLDWAWHMATFSSSVMRERASSTLVSRGLDGSRYAGTELLGAQAAASSTAAIKVKVLFIMVVVMRNSQI